MEARISDMTLEQFRALTAELRKMKAKQHPPVKPLKFVEETYDFVVHILAPCTPEQYSAYVQKVTGMDYEHDDSAASCFSTVDDVILGFANWSDSDKDIANLAHEIFHCASHSLSFRETKLAEQTEEAFAYLIGSLMLRCLRVLRARTRRELRKKEKAVG